MTDRERLIELLGHVEYQYTQSHSIMTENVVDYLIQKGVTAQRWIPVTEPPKEEGEYLVVYKSFFNVFLIEVVSYSNNLKELDEWTFSDIHGGGFYDYDSEYGYYIFEDVIYWMPLPELPKKVE